MNVRLLIAAVTVCAMIGDRDVEQTQEVLRMPPLADLGCRPARSGYLPGGRSPSIGHRRARRRVDRCDHENRPRIRREEVFVVRVRIRGTSPSR